MADSTKGNAGSAKPSGNANTTSQNTPRHKLIAMGQQPKGDGKGSTGQ